MLETIGYDAATAASFAPWDAADASVGRVTRVDRGVLTVLTETGPHRVSIGGALLGAVAQDPACTPCVGDWVVVRSWPDRRETVEHVLPRRTAFLQGYDVHAHAPVLAANVDLVGVVVDRDGAGARPAELSRLLDLAVASGARPVVVLTGAEPTGPTGPARRVVEAAAARGVEIVAMDPGSDQGLTRLRALVDGRLTLVLVGTSGRATASLARALLGADDIGAGHPRRGLALLPGGGLLLDLRHPAAPSLDGRTSSGDAW